MKRKNVFGLLALLMLVASNQTSLRPHKILNESDFKILVQLHQAKQEGDKEKVKQLSEQIGLFGGKHKMFGRSGRGRMI